MKITANSVSIGRSLRHLGKTLASAESCTGGLLGHQLTQVPGSSDYYLGGVVCYSDRSKTKLLRIPARSLKNHSAVSEYTARQMAQNVRKLFKADYGVGITGIAGPGGGTLQKPVGRVYLAVASSKRVVCKKSGFKGGRALIRSQAAAGALALLLDFLAGGAR